MGIISEICKDNGIKLSYATDAVLSSLGCSDDHKSGFACHLDGKYYICLPEDSSVYGKVFTAAHELAHILLGHIDCNSPAYSLPLDVKEDEANSFAGAFLALYLMKEYWNVPQCDRRAERDRN